MDFGISKHSKCLVHQRIKKKKVKKLTRVQAMKSFFFVSTQVFYPVLLPLVNNVELCESNQYHYKK